ncbi:MAG: hypothetical protein RSB52_08645 [Acidaminococcaceae bacterium]
MGVAGMIVGTLASGWLYGRSKQQQAETMAAQQDKNAQIADQNADKLQQQAKQQSQNDAMNAENKRRRLQLMEGQQLSRIGASGITATGSALTTLTDSKYAMESELGMDAYNAKQKTTNIFNQSTDFVNQKDIYKANASDYRAAGKRAMMTSMLTSAFSLAGNLYNGKSTASQGSSVKVNDGFNFSYDRTYKKEWNVKNNYGQGW